MSEANMIAAINVSSMANRLFFNGLLFDPAWMGFHELVLLLTQKGPSIPSIARPGSEPVI
jgi:hypothetical protein